MRDTTNFTGTNHMLKSIVEVSPKTKLLPGLRCVGDYRIAGFFLGGLLLLCCVPSPHVKAGLLQKHGKS